MFIYVLYGLAGAGLALSFWKDRQKTKEALGKAWKAFENILPQLLAILIIIGLALALLSPETITRLLGADSGVKGVMGAAAIGSFTLIPGFVALPMAAALLDAGAGYMQITAFVSTLMMVGIITAPLEIKIFGKSATIIRNVLAFLFSLLVAVGVGVLLG